jgi:Zn-finger nucleic acid-binding protein
MTPPVPPVPPPLSPLTPPAGSLHCPNCGAAIDEHAPQCAYCQARLATISCPACFKRLFLGASFCSHCGTPAARDEGEAIAKTSCPRCVQDMVAVRLGSLSLIECAKCGGIWVDAATFERLCADRAAQAAVLHGEVLHGKTATLPAQEERIRYRKCPRCQTMMNRINFARGAGVVLDICRKDGTFFDRDELHRVITFIQSGGLDRARKHEQADLEDEKRRVESLQRMHATANLREASAQEYSSSLGLRVGGSLFELFVGLLNR